MAKNRMKAEDRRREILEAAVRTIAANNFEKATTAMIAREAGVTEPLIYHHFKNKRGLQLAVLEAVKENVLSRSEEMKELDSVSMSRLRSYGKQRQREIRRNPEHVKIMIKALAVEDKKIKEKAWEIMESGQSLVRMLLSRAVRQGELDDKVDVEMGAWLIVAWAGLLSIVNILGKAERIPEERIDRFVALMDSYMTLGMAPEGKSASTRKK